MRSRLISLLALGAAACGQSALPTESSKTNRAVTGETLLASAGPEGVSLDNRGRRTVRFAVIDSVWFENALALWCLGDDQCGTPLPGGDRRLVPTGEIEGPAARGKAVQVLWWESPPGAPEENPGRFQRIHLRLP